MPHLSFGATSLRGRLALAGPILLAFAAPAAHGQGRSSVMSTRVVTTPSVMSTRVINTPSLMSTRTINTPSVTSTVTSNRTFTNPFLTNPFLTNPFLTNPFLTNPSLRASANAATLLSLQRNLDPFTVRDLRLNALVFGNARLDPFLRPDLRFDRFMQNLGPFAGAGFTGLAGATSVIPVGVGATSVIPVGVGAASVPPTTPTAGGTTAVAQKPSGDTGDAAKAALLQEQAIAEQLANRRRAFDELLYERDKTPTPQQELLTRSRVNPPLTEVLSGQALNALLDVLRAPSAEADPADRPNPRLPLDERGLRHINVTRGAGSIALLKDGGRLSWPAALAGPAFQVPRERLAARAVETVRRAGQGGGADLGTLRQMADDVEQLRALLRMSAPGLSFQSLYEARTFLQRFDDALVALGQFDAADHFNGKYELKAQTVLGLVRQMTDSGLRFAPAHPGDEAAYAALREAMAACERAAAKPPSAAR